MSNNEPNLPDALRPTEVTDFGDIFGAARRISQRVFSTVLLIATPLIARLHDLATEAGSRAASEHPSEQKS